MKQIFVPFAVFLCAFVVKIATHLTTKLAKEALRTPRRIDKTLCPLRFFFVRFVVKYATHLTTKFAKEAQRTPRGIDKTLCPLRFFFVCFVVNIQFCINAKDYLYHLFEVCIDCGFYVL